MISEAVSSARYVVVFMQGNRLGKRHQRFLEHLDKNGYIYLTGPDNLRERLEQIIKLRPKIKRLENRFKVSKALERLL